MPRPASPHASGSGATAATRRRPPRWLALLSALVLLDASTSQKARAEGQVQLQCSGTLLEARGQAERRRATSRLKISLGLEAEGRTADQALGLLQQRLAAVRSGLQALAAQELRVSSPSTWQRQGEKGQPAQVQASLQVSADLAPERLQALIRGIGSLAGVRLAPVSTEPDRREDAQVRQELLRQAYRDAFNQAQPLATLIGRTALTPLEIRIDGQELGMPAYRAMAASAPPPFNPDELNPPRDRLGLLVRFCAR